MKATISIGTVKVRVSGDAAAVGEALAPLLGLRGGGESVGPLAASASARVSREVEVFLAAHGFTPADYYRTRIGEEDVEAFVARREIEQAGIKFTRVAHRGPCAPTPTSTARTDVQQTIRGRRAKMVIVDDLATWKDGGVERSVASPEDVRRAYVEQGKRGPADRLPPELARLSNPSATMHEIAHFIHVDDAGCDVTGRRVHPPVVPDLKGQDPKAVRDRMNAAPRSIIVAGEDIAHLRSHDISVEEYAQGRLAGESPAAYIARAYPGLCKPTGCGLHPTEKGEAVPAPAQKPKARKAAPKRSKRGSR